MTRMSWPAPLNANEAVREATRNAATRVSALMISSVIPSLKYSFSGSALRLTNGSTAIEPAGGATGCGAASGGAVAAVAVRGVASASTSSAAVAKRSAGARASARATACSTQAGTVSRTVRRRGTGSSIWRARIA